MFSTRSDDRRSLPRGRHTAKKGGAGTKKVVILGGGVAGLSAAHELAERGFAVTVCERGAIPGGKARSVPVPCTGTGGRPHLPGEHGFRFFPGFYRHVTHTMKRIPSGQGRKSVYDNLVDATCIEILKSGCRPLITLARFPKSLADLMVLLKAFGQPSNKLGLTDDDIQFFASRLWQILTSCANRRLDEYEKIGWWDFIEAGRRSPAYRECLAGGLSRTLVAAQPKLANTRTGGDIFLQLLFNICAPGVSSDRVLNGPTNEVWINPWRDYLELLGVDYYQETTVTAIHHEDQKITGVTIQQGSAAERKLQGDYYIAALPVEVMGALLRDTSKGLLDGDPTLEGIIELSKHTAWMNGIQFYLKQDVPLAHGHQIYIDSAWAITSLSQQQFWTKPLSEYGDGTVRGILSVDVSEWKSPGIVHGKPAICCSREEIKDEVWAQLKEGLNTSGEELLKDENLYTWFLDPDILARRYKPQMDFQTADGACVDIKNVNLEPLLVNEINTWHLRPNAYTRIRNLFLAADYVRTNTDLATMEGANEAARRAVNAIIDASGSKADYCQVWELQEPWVFEAWRQRDQSRYDWGLPWREEVPWKLTVKQILRVAWANVRRWLRR